VDDAPQVPDPVPPGEPDEPDEPGQPDQEARNWAVIAHALGLLSSFIGPLVVLLTKGKENEYVADQSREALNFQITLMIAFAVAALLAICVVGVILFPALMVVGLVMPVVAAVKASEGATYRYPGILRLVS
jgi:hypothetical protein